MGSESRHGIRGKRFAVRHWGAAGGQPVLALHGWLDNCASFDFLAPLLQACRIAAPDLAGHGLTDPRSPDSAYNIWQDVGDIADLADALGWPSFSLVGHSRGGIIATLVAATFPERVCGLVLLDSLIPDPLEPARAPQQLAAALRDRRRLGSREPRLYENYEQAIRTRLRGPPELSRAATDAIAARGLEKTASGYRWRADPRLRGASEVKLSEAQCLAFIRGIRCPTLLLEAGGVRPGYHRRWAMENERIHVHTLPDAPHHLHMDGDVEAVAAAINAFLQSVN